MKPRYMRKFHSYLPLQRRGIQSWVAGTWKGTSQPILDPNTSRTADTRCGARRKRCERNVARRVWRCGGKEGRSQSMFQPMFCWVKPCQCGVQVPSVTPICMHVAEPGPQFPFHFGTSQSLPFLVHQQLVFAMYDILNMQCMVTVLWGNR